MMATRTILMSGMQRRATRLERGVSLIFALIALAVISLAAVALIRSVDTGALVIGNVGFKQDATASSDQGAEQAIAWLTGNVGGAQLDINHTDQGYLAASVSLLDATGNNGSETGRAVIDWAGDNCGSYPGGTFAGGCLTPKAGADVNGNKTQYLINRLCPNIGPANAAGNDCSAPLGGEMESSVRGELNYRKGRLTGTGGGGAYFRIVVRAVGGRNAVSYTETIVHY